MEWILVGVLVIDVQAHKNIEITTFTQKNAALHLAIMCYHAMILMETVGRVDLYKFKGRSIVMTPLDGLV